MTGLFSFENVFFTKYLQWDREGGEGVWRYVISFVHLVKLVSLYHLFKCEIQIKRLGVKKKKILFLHKYSLYYVIYCIRLMCFPSSTDLSLRLPPWEALVEEAEVLAVAISPLSDGLGPSLMAVGSGPDAGAGGTGSWITMTSSLLCWPRWSLAKSKPFTLGACN